MSAAGVPGASILEREGAGEPGRAHHVQRALEVLFGLAGEATMMSS